MTTSEAYIRSVVERDQLDNQLDLFDSELNRIKFIYFLRTQKSFHYGKNKKKACETSHLRTS